MSKLNRLAMRVAAGCFVITAAFAVGARAQDLTQLDATNGYKGRAQPYPSFADTLSQDFEGYRTALASYGFGISLTSVTLFQSNVLNTPQEVPSTYAPCTSAERVTYGTCAGNKAYFGQSPSYFNSTVAFLTYDLGRVGLDGGQLAVSGALFRSNDQSFVPDTLRLDTLSWYQPMFNKTLELKVGWLSTQTEMMGLNVGGNYANPFGPTALIPTELGMAFSPAPAPAATLKWNATDKIYSQFLVQRSLPLNGPTGNPIYDESHDQAGLVFASPINGTGMLYGNETGYKAAALRGQLSTWVRGGVLYNTSEFKDLSNLATGATRSGGSAYYLLADRQLWQQAPSSNATAYRGVYAGFTAMYTSPEIAVFNQYYEARLYWMGPLDSRPFDMLSFNYNHNSVSHYLAGFVNAFSSVSGIGANRDSNTATLVYTAQLRPGAYATLGLSYTDHPSVTYFPGEGSALNVVASLFFAL